MIALCDTCLTPCPDSVFVLVSDPNHEEPRFQVVTLADLPAELVAMVVDYAASASVVSLSGVARRYRAICLPDVMKVREAALASVVHLTDWLIRRVPGLSFEPTTGCCVGTST